MAGRDADGRLPGNGAQDPATGARPAQDGDHSAQRQAAAPVPRADADPRPLGAGIGNAERAFSADAADVVPGTILT